MLGRHAFRATPVWSLQIELEHTPFRLLVSSIMAMRKVAYYARNVLLDAIPPLLFQRQLKGILSDIKDGKARDVIGRVYYYNKLESYECISECSRKISNISMKKSFHYYDLKEYSRYFPRSLRISYQFGDITAVPYWPKFVKARPIQGDNSKSLLMKLGKYRHFYFPKDKIPFDDKRPVAVWRGGEHNPKRAELMRRYRGHPLCDIGYSHAKAPPGQSSPFLHPTQQMAYKYVISIEGNDVASNLKWILASNSLCMMPAPVYETWFMEGRLRPGEHYVQLDDTFDDLEEKILYYERHPGEAQDIVRNANRHVAPFRDETRERLISILVMYKYFIATRQIEPDEDIARLIWPQPR